MPLSAEFMQRFRPIDHDFVDPQARWTVPARVIANGNGAEFIITFFLPPRFQNAFFEEQNQAGRHRTGKAQGGSRVGVLGAGNPELGDGPLWSHGPPLQLWKAWLKQSGLSPPLPDADH